MHDTTDVDLVLSLFCASTSSCCEPVKWNSFLKERKRLKRNLEWNQPVEKKKPKFPKRKPVQKQAFLNLSACPLAPCPPKYTLEQLTNCCYGLFEAYVKLINPNLHSWCSAFESRPGFIFDRPHWKRARVPSFSSCTNSTIWVSWLHWIITWYIQFFLLGLKGVGSLRHSLDFLFPGLVVLD